MVLKPGNARLHGNGLVAGADGNAGLADLKTGLACDSAVCVQNRTANNGFPGTQGGKRAFARESPRTLQQPPGGRTVATFRLILAWIRIDRRAGPFRMGARHGKCGRLGALLGKSRIRAEWIVPKRRIPAVYPHHYPPFAGDRHGFPDGGSLVFQGYFN